MGEWERVCKCEGDQQRDNVPVLQYSYAPLLQQRLGGTDGVLCHAGTHSWLTRTWQPESLRPGGHAPVGSVLHPSSLQKKQTSDRLSIVKYVTIRNGQDQVHRHYMALESGLIEDVTFMVQFPVYYTCRMLTVPLFPVSC